MLTSGGVPGTSQRGTRHKICYWFFHSIDLCISLEGLMVKLKLQYFGHLIRITDSLEKTLMLGKIEGRRRVQQRMRCLDGITDSMDEFEQAPGVGDGQGSLACYSPWGCNKLDTTEQLNWNLIRRVTSKQKIFLLDSEHYFPINVSFYPRSHPQMIKKCKTNKQKEWGKENRGRERKKREWKQLLPAPSLYSCPYSYRLSTRMLFRFISVGFGC